MKKVLLIEDDIPLAEIMATGLQSEGYEVEHISSLPTSPDELEFQVLLRRANEFDFVIWDENVGKVKSSDGFIQAFRWVFNGPMLANSAEAENRQKQTSAGCDIECRGKSLMSLLTAVEDARKVVRQPV